MQFFNLKIFLFLIVIIFLFVPKQKVFADYTGSGTTEVHNANSYYQKLGTGLTGDLTEVSHYIVASNITLRYQSIIYSYTSSSYSSSGRVAYALLTSGCATNVYLYPNTENVAETLKFDYEAGYYYSGSCQSFSNFEFDPDLYYAVQLMVQNNTFQSVYGSVSGDYENGSVHSPYVTSNENSAINDLNFNIESTGSHAEDSGYIDIVIPVEEEQYLFDQINFDLNYWNYGESEAPYTQLYYKVLDSNNNIIQSNYYDIETDNIEEEKNIFRLMPPILETGEYTFSASLIDDNGNYGDFYSVDFTIALTSDYWIENDWVIANYPKEIDVYPPELYYKAGSGYKLSVFHSIVTNISPEFENYIFKRCITASCTAFDKTYIADTDYFWEKIYGDSYLSLNIENVVNSATVYYQLSYVYDSDIKSTFRFAVIGDNTDGIAGNTAIPDVQDICGNTKYLSEICKWIVPSSNGLKNIFFGFKDTVFDKFIFLGQIKNLYYSGADTLTLASTSKPVLDPSDNYKGISIQLWDMSDIEPYMPTFRNYFSILIWLTFITHWSRKILMLFKPNENTYEIKTEKT